MQFGSIIQLHGEAENTTLSLVRWLWRTRTDFNNAFTGALKSNYLTQKGSFYFNSFNSFCNCNNTEITKNYVFHICFFEITV